MSRFVAMHCGPEVDELQQRHPNAFLLLCQIARRAKWKDCPITGLCKGDAFIGDWKTAGLLSKKTYEVAKMHLEKCGLVGFQGGNKGTRATLLDSTIFSLSSDPRGEPRENPRGSQGASKGRPGGTNHTDIQNTQIHGHTDTKGYPPLALSPLEQAEPSAENIYSEYPRKVGKAEALKAIKKALKTHTAGFLLERTKAFAVAIQWQENQFIPYPATWFNVGHYDDDPKEWAAPRGSVPSGTSPEVDGEQLSIDRHKEKINGLRPQWSRPVHWNHAEDRLLHEGTAAQMDELEPDDWEVLRKYLAANGLPEKEFWRPNNRHQFVKHFPDVFSNAMRWAGQAGALPKPKLEGIWK